MLLDSIYLNDVLFVLKAAKDLDWDRINRTNFQKILFFCSILSPLVQDEWGYDFTNANFGPFNSDIHKATDIIVQYRYAKVTELSVRRNATLRASYEISDLGQKQIILITKLSRERMRLNWISKVMKVLDIYGNKVITKLAYQEPTFAEMRMQNRGGTIHIEISQNRSWQLLEKLCTELGSKYDIDLDTVDSQLITYFDFISKKLDSRLAG